MKTPEEIARIVTQHRRGLHQSFTQLVQEVELIQSLSPPAMSADVQQFHEKFGIDYKGKPRALDFELLQFRLKFLREEMTEFEAHGDQALFELDKRTRDPKYQVGDFAFDPVALRHHLAGMLDALMDLTYVALGTAHLQGFDADEAWRRVHRANMSKERPDGDATSAEGRIKLKMVKPEGWQAPDHIDLVDDHAHIAPHVEEP